MSLRVRLTVWNAVVLTAALLVSGVAVHVITLSKLITDVDNEILAEAASHKEFPSQLEAASLGSGTEFGKLLLKLQAELAKRDPNDPELDAVKRMPIRIFKANQTPLLGSQEVPRSTYDLGSFQSALSGNPDFRSVVIKGETRRVVSFPVTIDGSVNYVIQSIRPIEPIYRTMHALDHVLIQLLPFALLLAILGGAFLTGRSLRPIANLAAGAESITADTLDQRLPVEGNDELGRLARVINGMLGRLEGSFEAQRRFVADASHELRTPLTALKANTSLAISGPPDLDGYRTALTSADLAADAMTRLVNDLLFLSQSGAGQPDSRRELLNLSEVFLQTSELFASQCAEVGIEVKTESARGVALVANRGQIQRLLANLVSNAIRYTPRGGTILLKAIDLGASVLIEVIDTGAGITPEHLPHVFERFYRADDARSRSDGGYGLGLAICQSIVREHAGSISIASLVGTGTRVSISLPKGASVP